MGKKATKSTRKFAASGQLQKTIQARRKQRDIRKKVERRKSSKGKGKRVAGDAEEGEEGGMDVEDESHK